MEMQRFGVEDVAQPGDMARGIRVNPVRARRLACTAKQGGPTKHQTTPVTAAGQMQHRGICSHLETVRVRGGAWFQQRSKRSVEGVVRGDKQVWNGSAQLADTA